MEHNTRLCFLDEKTCDKDKTCEECMQEEVAWIKTWDDWAKEQNLIGG